MFKKIIFACTIALALCLTSCSKSGASAELSCDQVMDEALGMLAEADKAIKNNDKELALKWAQWSDGNLDSIRERPMTVSAVKKRFEYDKRVKELHEQYENMTE